MLNLRIFRTNASSLFPVFVLLVGGLQTALSQSIGGGLRGAVTDQSGAVIPNANLTLKSQGTDAVRSTKSTGDGLYSFSDIEPGPYTLRLPIIFSVDFGPGSPRGNICFFSAAICFLSLLPLWSFRIVLCRLRLGKVLVT